MLFEKVCGNPNIVTEAIEESEGVSEGWGTIAATVLTSPIGGGGALISNVFSDKALQELFRNNELVAYIKKECERIYKNEKKRLTALLQIDYQMVFLHK